MATMKDFAALKGLRRDLQEQEKARALALAERARRRIAVHGVFLSVGSGSARGGAYCTG